MHEQILIFSRKSNDTNPSIDDLFEYTDRHIDSIQLDATPSANELTSLFRDYCVDITVSPYIAKDDEIENFDTPIYEVEFGDSVRYGQMMYRNFKKLATRLSPEAFMHFYNDATYELSHFMGSPLGKLCYLDDELLTINDFITLVCSNKPTTLYFRGHYDYHY